MGFWDELYEGATASASKRLRTFFADDKSQVRAKLQTGNPQIAPPLTGYNLGGEYGITTTEAYLRLESDLMALYAELDAIESYGDLASALNVIADNVTQADIQRRQIVWATSKDKKILKVIDDLFDNTLRIDEEIWSIARSVCQKGNDFEEILFDKDGVAGLSHLRAHTMRRVEDERGTTYGFIQDTSGRGNFNFQQSRQLIQNKIDGKPAQEGTVPPGAGTGVYVAAFEPFEMVHFRLRLKDRQSVYGTSVLANARSVVKRIWLLEDSAMLHQLQKAQDRLVFYVDVGDSPPQEALAALTKYRHQLNKKRFIDPATNQLSLKFNPLPVAHDTPIPLLDGRVLTIAELAQEFEAGLKPWVYSIDTATRSFVPGEVSWVGKTREQAPAVRVTFDDGGVATMAPDHPVMLRNGTYVEAVNLQPGSSVMPLYRRISSKAKGESMEGYELVYDPALKKSVYTHRRVGRTLGLVGTGQVAHHRSFNKLDNRPENLEGKTRREHSQLHHDEGHTSAESMLAARRNSPELDLRLRELGRETITRYNKSPKHADDMRRFNAQRDYGVMAETLRNSPTRAVTRPLKRAAMKGHWQNPDKAAVWKANIIAALKIEFPTDFIEGVKALLRSGATRGLSTKVNSGPLLGLLQRANPRIEIKAVHRHLLLKMFRSHGCQTVEAFQQMVGAHPNNHKVVKVETVTPCDHYCMTVEKQHNFALCLRDENGVVQPQSGIFVKNSSEDHILVPVRKGADGSRIDTLSSQGWPSTELLEFFQNRLYASIGMPRSYLTQSDVIDKSPLSSKDIQFARLVLRIQQELIGGLSHVVRQHLIVRNMYDPTQVQFKINMPVPSAIYELAQMEVNNARADFATRMDLFVSRHWILSKVFAMSDDEIETIFKEKTEDVMRGAVEQAQGQAQGQQILAPPPEAGGAPAPAPEGVEARERLILTSARNFYQSRQPARWDERSLLEGNRAHEKQLEAKLDKLVLSDARLAKRLESISGLMGDLSRAVKPPTQNGR